MTKPNATPPVSETAKVRVAAPIDIVWATLVQLRRWPEWNDAVSSMDIQRPVAPGSEFQWVAGGARISSRIEVVEEPGRIAWSGRTRGIEAAHEWLLSADGQHTEVTTTESFRGFVVRIAPWFWRRVLRQALEQGLQALQREAERRALSWAGACAVARERVEWRPGGLGSPRRRREPGPGPEP